MEQWQSTSSNVFHSDTRSRKITNISPKLSKNRKNIKLDPKQPPITKFLEREDSFLKPADNQLNHGKKSDNETKQSLDVKRKTDDDKKIDNGKRQKSNFKQKAKPLNIKIDKKDENKTKSTYSSGSRKLKRYPSSSEIKYNVKVPSFEAIIKYQKNFETYKKCVEEFDSFDGSIFKTALTLKCLDDESKGEALSCKHLTMEQVDGMFRKHEITLRAIRSGKIFSKRHNKFHNPTPTYQLTTNDLSYSPILLAFTQAQLDHVFDRILESFCAKEEFGYLFKVMLPELCLLIFMDVHDMTAEEADDYLDKCPVSA